MENLKKLNREELKNVVGGGYDYTAYANCMSGWNYSTHTEQENNRKIDFCDGVAQNQTT